MLAWLPPWLYPTAGLRRRPRPRRRLRFCRLEVEELESRLTPSGFGTLGLNTALTTDPGVQQMPSIVADPLDANHLVTAYMDYALVSTGYAGIGVAVSDNAGATWQHTSIPLPANFAQGAATPSAQFDTHGDVFVSFAAATFPGPLPPITDPMGGAPRALGFQANNGIFVARSGDGGLTWNTPVAVAAHLYDGTNPVPFEIKPDLAIDTFQNLPNGQPNPYYGDLYEVWSRYYPAGQFPNEPDATGGSDIKLAVSQDAGRSWQIESQPVAVVTDVLSNNNGLNLAAGTGFENGSHVAIGPEGDIDVVQGTSQVTFYHSTDGGASFTQPNLATGAGFPFGSLLDAIPSLTLTNDQFRTQAIHDVAADPTRPSYVYVVVSTQISDRNGNPLDSADVLFARSTDYGVTWQTTFQVGPYTGASVLNDENGGQRATGAPGDVIDGQALPRLATDAQGDIGVIWYDTRRDPGDTLLDVYGAISTDGGQTFSSNFRVTDQSFNPNLGTFTDATGQTDYYLGDAIGLVMANGTAYAAWTDTRNGNQDVYFSSFPINPPPPPLSNRFAPNATADTATDLGKVVTRDLPKLAIAAGDEEWFQLQAAATGSLTVTATLAAPADTVRLELYDASGTMLLASGTALLNAGGQVSGQSLTFPGQSGQTYLVRVLPGPAAVAATPPFYTLDLQSLTANLGGQVYGVENGALEAGQDAYYALSVPAAGSLEVILTPGTNAHGNFHLELLDPSNLSVLASGQAVGTTQQASLAPTQGQAVYLHVFGDAGTQGDFSLEVINLDQFTTPDNQTLFFPTGGNPSQVAVTDLNNDGKLDTVVDYADQNFVSVLLNNGDGTFQAPRDYAVGSFGQNNPSSLGGLPNDKRALVVADLNHDGIPDLAVLAYESGGVSILLGRGDGTFAPQHLIGTLSSPFALAVGDLNNDGVPDLVVVSSTGGPAQPGEVLLGRGDGTFEAPIPFTIPSDPGFPTSTIQIADFNHDGKNDLMYEGYQTYALLGNGNGSFQPATPIGLGLQGGLDVIDLNGDGKLDVVTTAPEEFSNGTAEYALGNGDGSFQPPVLLTTGQAPVAVAVADLGSQVTLPDGTIALGPPDGIPDLIVANNGIVGNFSNGPPDIVIVPGLADGQGRFNGFGSPFTLAAANSPLDLKVADVNNDGVPDVVVAEATGIEVIYGKPLTLPPNATPQMARNLGVVVHLVEPTQTIVPGHEDGYYTLTVPTENVAGAGDEVLDFSGLFQDIGGAGITMEVRRADGSLLGSGERFRVLAPPGEVLTLHVFGLAGGTGAYTLDIDVLPQLVSVQAEALLPGATAAPGGPTASLVLTFQGDRLDPASAEVPGNYTVTWLGPDGSQAIPAQAAVYDPSANIDVASGITYATAVRQTVTLVFAQPLPAGSYFVDLSAAIQAAPFNPGEAALLAPAPGLTGHTIVALAGGIITEGDDRALDRLVPARGTLGSFTAFKNGTPFLTQLHDDLGAQLDAQLTALGDAAGVSAGIDQQIVDRFTPALGPIGQRPVGMLVIWLDPVSPTLVDPQGNRVVYNQQASSFVNTLGKAYVNVTGNLEVIVLPIFAAGAETLSLSVGNVAASVRGGVEYFGADGNEVRSLTADLRSGTTDFLLSYGSTVLSLPGSGVPTAPTAAVAQVVPGAASPTQSSVTFALTRTESASVTAIGPLFQVNLANVPPGPGTPTALQSVATALLETVNSAGFAGPALVAPDASVRQVLSQVNEGVRTILELTRGIGDWLRALAEQLRVGDNPPAPAPPRMGEMPMQPPPQAEAETQGQTPEAIWAMANERAQQAKLSAGNIGPMVGLGVCLVGLSASGPIHQRRRRDRPRTAFGIEEQAHG